jgi:hypothetical protein
MRIVVALKITSLPIYYLTSIQSLYLVKNPERTDVQISVIVNISCTNN